MKAHIRLILFALLFASRSVAQEALPVTEQSVKRFLAALDAAQSSAEGAETLKKFFAKGAVYVAETFVPGPPPERFPIPTTACVGVQDFINETKAHLAGFKTLRLSREGAAIFPSAGTQHAAVADTEHAAVEVTATQRFEMKDGTKMSRGWNELFVLVREGGELKILTLWRKYPRGAAE